MPYVMHRLSDEIIYRAIAENLLEIQKSYARICEEKEISGSIDFDLKRTFFGDKVFVEFKLIKSL